VNAVSADQSELCHALDVERVLNMSAAELAAERPDGAGEDVHFTQALVREIVERYSAAGDVVLDPFAGYGTTLLVSHQLGRKPIGVELLPERAELIRQRLDPSAVVVEGDARQLDRFGIGSVDLCLTSPPYMGSVDHPQNPLTGYATLDGDYSTYLREILGVFLAVKRCLRHGGYLVINAANIRTGDIVTPLAWDIARDLRPHFAFRGEIYLRWDHPLDFISGDYCLVFEKVD
jgi:DNA modification methylase